ncbi:hypothetical protein LXL04_019935 [Taraxacum kok-saghyz]
MFLSKRKMICNHSLSPSLIFIQMRQVTGYCLRSNHFLTSSAGNQATSSSPARFRPLHLLRRDSGELISRFSSHNPLLLLRRPFHSPEENSTKPDTSETPPEETQDRDRESGMQERGRETYP